MPLPVDAPSESEVRAQYARICEHKLFSRAPTLRDVLKILVDEWLINGGKNLNETLIGERIGEQRVPEEKETADNHGFPKTRANLRHVRNRLMDFFETQGYLDLVIIKLNKGSYVPAIGYNRNLPLTSKVDPFCDRLILRAKTMVETRKFSKLEAMLQCFDKLIATESKHPRVQANLAFLLYAAVPIFPNAVNPAASRTAATVEELRAIGIEPWELTFADACFHASSLHEWFKALGLFQTAVVNSQGEASYYWWYTAVLAAVGSVEEAVEILDAAVHHFARTNVATRLDLAMLQIIAKRFSEAEETLLSLVEIQGEAYVLAGYFMLLYEAQDKLDEALSCGLYFYNVMVSIPEEGTTAFYEHCGVSFLFLGMLGLVLARAERFDEAREVHKRLTEIAQKSGNRTPLLEFALPIIGVLAADLQQVSPTEIAALVTLLDAAAFDQFEPTAMWFHIFPPLRHLREVPEFQALLKKLNLPPTRRP